MLLVEDEPALRESLAARLREQGYVVDPCADGEEGHYYGAEYQPDVAIVDLGLPGLSGMELIQRFRTQSLAFPILVLTARGAWQDKVEALEVGADDYLVKPFHTEELLARLNALVRRSAGFSQPRLTAGPIELDTSGQSVTVDENPVELTSYEYRLLEYLMLHPTKVVSKAVLTDHLYEQDFERDSNVIEVFIGRLRKKLDPKSEIRPIETLRGRGYRLAGHLQ